MKTQKETRKPWKVAAHKTSDRCDCFIGEYRTLSEAREHIREIGDEGYVYNTVTKKERVYCRK
jgi:hypothetical protein